MAGPSSGGGGPGSSEVTSVIMLLNVQATGAMASAGAPHRKPSPSERMSVRLLALNLSAMAKPVLRSRMMFYCNLQHLPQSMSFSPSFLPPRMINNSVAIMIVTVPSPTLLLKRIVHPGIARLLVIRNTIRPQRLPKPSSLQRRCGIRLGDADGPERLRQAGGRRPELERT